MKLRASGARRSALLPAAQTPVIAAGRTASAGEVDAVLAVVPPPAWAHVASDISGFGVRFALELLLRRDARESLERAG